MMFPLCSLTGKIENKFVYIVKLCIETQIYYYV